MTVRPNNVCNIADVPKQVAYGDFTELHKPTCYTGTWQSISRHTGAKYMHTNVLTVRPGCSAAVYHWHTYCEESIYIISGTGTARINNKLYTVQSGTYHAYLPILEHCHQLINTGTVDLVYICCGVNVSADVCGYPDSGKYAIEHKSIDYILDYTIPRMSYFDREDKVHPLLQHTDTNTNTTPKINLLSKYTSPTHNTDISTELPRNIVQCTDVDTVDGVSKQLSIAAGGEQIHCTYVKIKQNDCKSVIKHKSTEVYIYILSGTGSIKYGQLIDDLKVIQVTGGDFLTLPIHTYYQSYINTTDTIEYLQLACADPKPIPFADHTEHNELTT